MIAEVLSQGISQSSDQEMATLTFSVRLETGETEEVRIVDTFENIAYRFNFPKLSEDSWGSVDFKGRKCIVENRNGDLTFIDWLP